MCKKSLKFAYVYESYRRPHDMPMFLRPNRYKRLVAATQYMKHVVLMSVLADFVVQCQSLVLRIIEILDTTACRETTVAPPPAFVALSSSNCRWPLSAITGRSTCNSAIATVSVASQCPGIHSTCCCCRCCMCSIASSVIQSSRQLTVRFAEIFVQNVNILHMRSYTDKHALNTQQARSAKSLRHSDNLPENWKKNLNCRTLRGLQDF